MIEDANTNDRSPLGRAFARALAAKDFEQVGGLLHPHNPDGDFLVEQQAYLEPRDELIGWLRIACSGFRPLR